MTDGLRWLRILLLGPAIVVATWVFVFLVVTGYAVYLGFQAMGPPDQARIEGFVASTGSTIGLAAGVLLAVLFGWLGARRTGRPLAHGVAIGCVAAVVGLGLDVLDGLSGLDVLQALLFLGGAALGGRLIGAPAATESPTAVAR